MKLSIKLVSKNGGVQAPPYWSYLRIPTPLLARSKLKKSQQQKLLDGSSTTMVSDESKVLNLEARVVCESDEEKIIKMCQGCVRREVIIQLYFLKITVSKSLNTLFQFTIAKTCREKEGCQTLFSVCEVRCDR